MSGEQSKFTNFDKNKRSERPKFTDGKDGRPKGGFGERMGAGQGGGFDQRPPRTSEGDRNNGQQSGKRSYGDRGDNQNGDRRANRDNWDQSGKKQRGSDWIESSEFCRTNVKTGEVKWKEEYWTNKCPNTTDGHMCDPNKVRCTSGVVHMYEVKRDGRGLGFHVPSTWKFQNCEPASFNCKCGAAFSYEMPFRSHVLGCTFSNKKK